jgi:pyridinium-3,5-bisthiocarboxylic acid mononucleotide nickel chelatase
VLLTSLAGFKQPGMSINKVGYGAGSKDFENWPNVVRVWIGETTSKSDDEKMVLLETNIDDMNPQIYGYLIEKLFEEKAIDVWFTPIQMKKNRPAVMLSILAPAQAESGLIELVMRETSTLGIRTRPVSRHIARRETVEFKSSLGSVKMKVKYFSGDSIQVAPEYEDCKHIAMEKDMPLQEVMRIIKNEAHEHLSSSGDPH